MTITTYIRNSRRIDIGEKAWRVDPSETITITKIPPTVPMVLCVLVLDEYCRHLERQRLADTSIWREDP